MGADPGHIQAGAKARVDFGAVAARLKSCPVTKQAAGRVFAQLVKSLRKEPEERANRVGQHPPGAKARVDLAAVAARLKSCPVTKQVAGRVFAQLVKSLRKKSEEKANRVGHHP